MRPLRIARPSFLRDLRLDRSAVLEASAGTGKTYALESILTDIVFTTDVDLERVLLVTFTERATSELRSRMRARLESLHSGRVEPASESDIALGDCWTLDEAAKSRVVRAIHSFDSITIATIHAFCQRVLGETTFATGRLFQEQPIDGRDAFGRAVKDALRVVANDAERAPWLDAALREGWTVARIEELLWNCFNKRCELRPSIELGSTKALLSQWPQAAAESPDLVDEIRRWGTDARTAKRVVELIRELSAAVMGSQGEVARYVAAARALKLDDLAEKIGKLPVKPGSAAEVCEVSAKLARLTPPMSAGVAQSLLPVVSSILSRAKRASGRYDFDDMLIMVDEALKGPQGPALAAEMRNRWRFALIDEFQDTDETQWSIFQRAFFAPAASTAPSRIFLVGDPKQSIYRFRGADVATYRTACSTILEAGGQRVTLEASYRATPPLVESLNAIFESDRFDSVFDGETTYAPVRCGRHDRLLLDADSKPLSPVHLVRFEGEPSLPAFARLVAREVGLMTDPVRPWRIDGRALEPGDAFVLTRNAREGRVIGEALRALGVPHEFYKEEGLFQSDEAADLATVLAAVADPSDRGKCFSAWLTPFFGLPITALERARDLPPGHPLLARLLGWKALADARDFSRLFESLLRQSGIVRREIFFGHGERTITNLQHLMEILSKTAQAGHRTVDDLVTELEGLRARTRTPLELEGSAQRQEGDRSAVQIMTIHKAKGLEAPVVFVAGGATSPPGDEVRRYRSGGQRLAWVGRAPTAIDELIKQQEREEEARVMYVALTRAMGRLVLPCISEGGRAKRLRGAYDCINGRLFRLAQTPSLGWTSEPATPVSMMTTATARSTDPSWQPPAAFLENESDEETYDVLRERATGSRSTSYTRMKAERQEGRGQEAIPSATPAQETTVSAARPKHRDTPDAEPAPTTLRAARASGVFLHEVLERVPLASFRQADFTSWRARSDVAPLLTQAMATHRVPSVQREHTERLVWAAFTTPLELPDGSRIDNIASSATVVREMRYVFSLADAVDADPARRAASQAPEVYVRGSLDLVFEIRGRVYFVDWKSDSLESYASEHLDPHVAEHYREQRALYALALVKLLGIHTEAQHRDRFGGMIYCFLRGFDAHGRGVWRARPGWGQLLRWAEDLRASRPLSAWSLA